MRSSDVDGALTAPHENAGCPSARLATLESRFDDLAREIRGQTWRLMTLMVAFVGVIVAAVRL